MSCFIVFVTLMYFLGDTFSGSGAVRISISASYPYLVRPLRAGFTVRRNAKSFLQYQPAVPTVSPPTQYYQGSGPLQQPLSTILPANFVRQPITYHQPITIYPPSAQAPATNYRPMIMYSVPMPSYMQSYAGQQPIGGQVEYSYSEPLNAPGNKNPVGYEMRGGGGYGGGGYGGEGYGGGGYGGGGYGDDYQRDDYGYMQRYDDRGGYEEMDSYGNKQNGYGYKKDKPKVVYVPVYKRRKKKKKMKIISIMPGFYVAGGTQLFGKYKTLKACEHACAATPSCFAGDYNPWLKKCYIHTNFTACQTLRAHKKLTHFSKVPCQIPEAPMGLVTLGTQLFRGIEQKGIKSLTDCLKRCATAGNGIPQSVADIDKQLCFGIDYDFGSHKCYFHVDNTNNRICPADGSQPKTPRDLVANPSVINIILCPGP